VGCEHRDERGRQLYEKPDFPIGTALALIQQAKDDSEYGEQARSAKQILRRFSATKVKVV